MGRQVCWVSYWEIWREVAGTDVVKAYYIDT